MNTDVIESVLNEILNEQKEAIKINKQLISKMEYLFDKFENLTDKINTYQNISSIKETKGLEIITERIENLKQVVVGHQENGIDEKRIIIFPEFNSPECYRLLFKCITHITIATYGFLILKVVVEHWCR